MHLNAKILIFYENKSNNNKNNKFKKIKYFNKNNNEYKRYQIKKYLETSIIY